jgi:AraC family transcriptional regulator, regulatory protein of adaptative response / methylated-DNA-[protein]-cysteine methyltransferase
MAPPAYRKGASGERIRYGLAPCVLGWVLVAATERGICAIDLADDSETLRARLNERFPGAALAGDPGLGPWVEEVAAFIAQPARGLDLPLDIRGTAFQQRVWEELRAIPAGATSSYAAIAARIGRPGAVRAVAACAANTLAVAVTCHRVLRSDGTLSGYRWGIERKRELLRFEAKREPDNG